MKNYTRKTFYKGRKQTSNHSKQRAGPCRQQLHGRVPVEETNTATYVPLPAGRGNSSSGWIRLGLPTPGSSAGCLWDGGAHTRFRKTLHRLLDAHVPWVVSFLPGELLRQHPA